MRRSSLLLVVVGLVVVLLGGAFVLSLGAKPTVQMVEKVFPDDRFPR